MALSISYHIHTHLAIISCPTGALEIGISLRGAAAQKSAGRSAGWKPSTQLEKYLDKRYGPVLGNALMRMLKGGDLFKSWRAHQDEAPPRNSSLEKEEYARQSAKKGNSFSPIFILYLALFDMHDCALYSCGTVALHR